MMCAHPVIRTVHGKRYLSPCGKCELCTANEIQSWAIRILDEGKMHDRKTFLTLTYDDDHLPLDGSLHYEHIAKFFHDLRQGGFKVRYAGCGEYGDKRSRPHWHLAFYGADERNKELFSVSWDEKDAVYRGSMKYWPYGLVALGFLTSKSARYIAKYMFKRRSERRPEDKGKRKDVRMSDGRQVEMFFCSGKPGIGGDFVKKYAKELHDRGFCYFDNRKVALPRYYKQKVYTDDELLQFSDEWSEKTEDVLRQWFDVWFDTKAQKLRYDLKPDLADKGKSRLSEFRSKLNLKRKGKVDDTSKAFTKDSPVSVQSVPTNKRCI